ncbi:MAG: hypothetical protein KAR06_02425, partial [Deltaproteobacteria bacterium]|nr:hypothetical protein [Deltaproteobacteria bacterium]
MKKLSLILLLLVTMPAYAAVSTNPDVTGITTNGGGDAATLDGYSSTQFFNRTNHTGFQIASTISDFND